MMRTRALWAAAAAVSVAGAVQCTGASGVMFSGRDLNYTFAPTPGACCGACGDLAGCVAYSWAPDVEMGGRCYLKSGPGETIAQQDAVSGFVAGASSADCPYYLTPCAATGACALFGDWCSAPCKAGEIVCPDGLTCAPAGTGFLPCPALPQHLNTSLPLADRVAWLVNELTLDEIGAQLSNLGYGPASELPGPPGIERPASTSTGTGNVSLSVPPYNWLNEGLHGVARSGYATSMPQASVVGCTWNRTVFSALGHILGIEARAKHTMYRRLNDTENNYRGISFYAPNINAARDARWGRIQEVPSEDPSILAAYATAVVQAAQAPSADDPEGPPAIAACCKHTVAYSVEGGSAGIPARNAFNAVVSGHDLLEYYLPAFQACFMQGGGRSSMCSYNAVNGVPTCASNFLLNATIRARYGMASRTDFSGFWVMSDYGAVGDAFSPHGYCSTAAECTAKVMQAGVDQDGGGLDFHNASSLVAAGLLDEATVRTAATRLFTARMELGLLDPPETTPFQEPALSLDTDENRQASADAARQGIVLLANSKGALPLPAIQGAAVIGPNADNPSVLLGNYQGTPPYIITPRGGLVRALGNNSAAVTFAPGCPDIPCTTTSGFAAATAAAQDPSADVVVLVLGLDQTQEAEGRDRQNITLPGNQLPLAQAVQAAVAARARPVPFVVVLVNGGPLDVSWLLASADAVVLLGYASQSAGDALADVLLGHYNPGGRLAVTWPQSVSDLPLMGDMGIVPNATAGNTGRTYRYAVKTPLLPFGYGLSYTEWSYAGAVVGAGSAQASAAVVDVGGAIVHAALPAVRHVAAKVASVDPCSGVTVNVTLTNAGALAGTEVVQVYINLTAPGAAGIPASWSLPRWWLAGFDRVALASGSSATLSFTVPPRALAVVNGSAAATFGQQFAVPAEAMPGVVSGAAFGLGHDYTAEAARVGAGPIGWDDMFLLPSGASYSVWVGGGQPGFGAPGAAATFTTTGTAGSFVNLASCAITAATRKL